MLIFGIILEIIACLSGIGGKQLLRYSHVNDSNIAYAIGIFMQVAVGPASDFSAYAFAPQSVLIPFAGLDVVLNTLIAPFTLGEPVTPRRLAGTVLVSVGTVVAVVFGPHDDVSYSAAELPAVYLGAQALSYYISFIAWAMICRHMLRSTPVFRGFALGALGGSLAGNGFFMKATMRLLSTTPFLTVIVEPMLWVSAVGAASVAIGAMNLLSKASKEFETIFLTTVFEGALVVSGSISGMLVMNEAKLHPTDLLTIYALGVVIILLGLYVTCDSEAQLQHKDDSEKASPLTMWNFRVL